MFNKNRVKYFYFKIKESASTQMIVVIILQQFPHMILNKEECGLTLQPFTGFYFRGFLCCCSTFSPCNLMQPPVPARCSSSCSIRDILALTGPLEVLSPGAGPQLRPACDTTPWSQNGPVVPPRGPCLHTVSNPGTHFLQLYNYFIKLSHVHVLIKMFRTRNYLFNAFYIHTKYSLV